MKKRNLLKIITSLICIISTSMIFSQKHLSPELTTCDFKRNFEIPHNVDFYTLFSIGSYQKFKKRDKLIYDTLKLDVKIFSNKILISSLISNENIYISSKEDFKCKLIGYRADLHYLSIYYEIFLENCIYLISVNYLKNPSDFSITESSSFSITQYDNY